MDETKSVEIIKETKHYIYDISYNISTEEYRKDITTSIEFENKK